MSFSKAAFHGICMLCYLSRQDAGSVTSAATLAKAADAPSEHARKILMRLCAAGLVTATHGRSGGYAPAKTMEDVSVLDVLDAVGPMAEDHDLQLRMCAAAPEKVCFVEPALADLRERTQRLLACTTLASFTDGLCRKPTTTCEITAYAGSQEPVDDVVAAS